MSSAAERALPCKEVFPPLSKQTPENSRSSSKTNSSEIINFPQNVKPAPNTQKPRSFEGAQKFVQQKKIKSSIKYRKLKKEGLLPKDMPASPERTYRDKGWTTWGDFLGKKYRSFEATRKFVKQMDIKNQRHFNQLHKDGLLPDDIHSAPARFFKDKGWRGWRDFLGTEFKLLLDAQKFVQSMKIKGKEEYHKLKKEGLLPKDMHSSPEAFYKDKGWKGWKDFLGTTIMMKYNQAKKHAIYEAKINTVEEFIEWLKSDELPLNFPPNPAEFYEEWTSAKDFLDLNNQKEMMTHLEFKEFIHKLSFKTKRDLIKWMRSEDRLEFIPPHPETFYEKEWEGWGTYLIPPQKKLTQDVQQIYPYSKEISFEGFLEELAKELSKEVSKEATEETFIE